jgi:hypothetical protein
MSPFVTAADVIVVWPVKHHAADDLDARAQSDRIGRKPASLVHGAKLSSLTPTSPTLSASPGIPALERVTMGREAKPGSCS